MPSEPMSSGIKGAPLNFCHFNVCEMRIGERQTAALVGSATSFVSFVAIVRTADARSQEWKKQLNAFQRSLNCFNLHSPIFRFSPCLTKDKTDKRIIVIDEELFHKKLLGDRQSF